MKARRSEKMSPRNASKLVSTGPVKTIRQDVKAWSQTVVDAFNRLADKLYGGTMMSFLLLALASIVSLVAIAVFFVTGQYSRAGRILVRWGIGVAAYAAILVVVAMRPQNLPFKPGVPFCDDDMCGSIENIVKTPSAPGEVTYRLDFRLFSKANHGPRSTRGAAVYLTDDRNRCFLPVHDSSAIPFDVAIQPGQSVNTSLTFNVPADTRTLFFAASMERIQYASFVIGNGDLLHKPRTRFRIQ